MYMYNLQTEYAHKIRQKCILSKNLQVGHEFQVCYQFYEIKGFL